MTVFLNLPLTIQRHHPSVHAPQIPWLYVTSLFLQVNNVLTLLTMYWLSSQAVHRPLGQLAATMWLDGSSPCYFFAANQTNGFSVACTSGYVFESFLAQNYSLYKSSLNVDQANKHMTSQE